MGKRTDRIGTEGSKNRPRSGEPLELEIAALDEEGYGVGLFAGRPVRVWGVLPGETAQVRVTFAGRRETFADAVKIVHPSPERLARPPCSKGAFCEGCPLVLMAYPAQLDWKRGLVESAVRPYTSLRGAVIHGVIPSPKALHYRNSAKLVVAGKFAAPVIGMYRRHSHEVIDIGDCPLHHPLINRVAQAVREGIRKGKVPIYNPKSGSGILRYLVVRVSESENRVMVVFVTARRSFNEIHHLAKHLRAAVPEVAVVVQNINPSEGNVILGREDIFVTRERAITDRIGDTRFSISPRSFFQVNGGGAGIIYERVREWGGLTGEESVLDLYCGIGGISLFLAAGAREVLGIEAVDEAVTDAEKNARLNNVRNCRFEAGDALELLEELRGEGKRFDLIVLNPPRKGCDERVLLEVAALKPGRIIYVSCSPRTLARDLDILAGMGYATREVQPVDMFPQTVHVESVALLERQ